MSKVIRVRYEKGVLKPLEPIDIAEGEEAYIVIVKKESVARKFYGIARKHRPELSKKDFAEAIEEIEDEDIR
ncbi:hypothetical protein PYJP_05690 [Pyrofollis japonicus]|nr:antitoxin family protein [Pyrofollis japonicus]BEP17217.1 hypothetical protein PYJP_05690 [Pyrofollis japonicus]